MNKKQLTVAWIATAILCFMILFTPQKHVRHSNGEIIVYDEPQFTVSMIDGKQAKGCLTTSTLQWSFILPRSLVILLISGLLIYTLRDKRKESK